MSEIDQGFENKYKMIFEQAAVGMVFCNLKNEIQETNAYFATMLGYETADMIGKGPDHYTHPEDVEKGNLRIREILEGKNQSFTFEKRYIHKDGHVVWAEITVSAVRDSSGAVTQLYAIIKDISEAKSIRRSLENQRALFSITMDRIPFKAFLKDPEGSYIACNTAYAKDLNIEPSDIVGKNDHDYYDKYSASKYRDDDQRIMKNGKPEEYVEEYAINGRSTWVLTMKAPVYKDDEIIGIVGTFTDLTDKIDFDKELLIQAETSLHEADKAKETLQLIFDTTEDLLCLLDRNGVFKKVSPSWTRELGYMQDELVDMHSAKILHPDDLERFDASVEEMRRQGGGLNQKADLRILSKDGSYVWYGWIIRLVGGIVVASGRNITKQKETERYLVNSRISAEKARLSAERARISSENARIAAVKASNAKSEFLANISHEIRTPLNVIIGFSDLLSMRLTDKSLLKSANAINLAGNSLLALINDILDLSKIEAGMMNLMFEDVHLNQLLDEIGQIFSSGASKKGLKLVVVGDSAIPWTIAMDLKRTRQILLNIVGNAVKFTDEGSVILESELIDEYEDGSVDISIHVTDTGIGIRDEDQAAIFQSFRQQSEDVNRRYGGTGLGLSISKKLAEIMGGTLCFTSEVGIGSRFTLTLKGIMPIVAVQEPNATGRSLDDGELIFKNARILVVDDEELNRDLMSEILKGRCQESVCVSSGKEAVRLAGIKDFDMIIMDMVMPEISGIETAKMIRDMEGHRHTPIVCFSANILDEEDMSKYSDLFDDYLTKPVHMTRLLEVMAKYL